jgi:RNA polymerase sigma-70 factor (ECF subfamily)
MGAEPEVVFRRLYEAHHAAVLGYCRRRTDPGDAQDITAEVFAIAWRRIDDVPPGEQSLIWLYGVAYRVLGHHWRSRRRRMRLRDRLAGLGGTTAPGPETVVVQRASDRELVLAAQRLRPLDQEILRLAGWEDLPHGEIAEILGISVDAVDQRFHRAKKRLAAEYDRARSRSGRTDPRGGTA